MSETDKDTKIKNAARLVKLAACDKKLLCAAKALTCVLTASMIIKILSSAALVASAVKK